MGLEYYSCDIFHNRKDIDGFIKNQCNHFPVQRVTTFLKPKTLLVRVLIKIHCLHPYLLT